MTSGKRAKAQRRAGIRRREGVPAWGRPFIERPVGDGTVVVREVGTEVVPNRSDNRKRARALRRALDQLAKGPTGGQR